MPSSSSSDTSTKCVASDGARDQREPHARTTPPVRGGSRNSQRVGGVADRVERGEPDVAVVGHVEVRAAPGLVVVERDDDLGPVPADREREVAPQRDAVLDQPVGMIEELDRRRRPTIAALARSSASRTRAHSPRFERVDPGLTAGHEQIAHVLAAAPSSARPPPRRRTPCRRDGRRSPARVPSRREPAPSSCVDRRVRLGRHERDRHRQARTPRGAASRSCRPGCVASLTRPSRSPSSARARVEIGDGRREPPELARPVARRLGPTSSMMTSPARKNVCVRPLPISRTRRTSRPRSAYVHDRAVGIVGEHDEMVEQDTRRSGARPARPRPGRRASSPRCPSRRPRSACARDRAGSPRRRRP